MFTEAKEEKGRKAGTQQGFFFGER